jgi:outer membrane receptor protein involved in Fe transport
MRVQRVVSWIVVVGALTSWSPRAAVGQQLALAARTPRFFYASSTAAKPMEIDVRQNEVLGRVVSLNVEHTTIGGLLADIQRQTGLTFAYDRHFPATRPVTLQAESITVAAALGAILVGTGVDVVLTPTGHVWLTESELRTPPGQQGGIVGKVSDKQTGNPLVGATVTVEPAQQSATTRGDGQYRFANLNPGNYMVRARYIGYRGLEASAAVRADQDVVVDFLLEKSAQQLEEVVTTGTLVPTEVKALPTPVSVISAEDIELQQPHSFGEIFRQTVPTALTAEEGFNSPAYTAFSARGATSLSGGSSGQLKIFVDGIETAFPRFGGVDPSSIERIEVIRGPQAAAIYGSDAIGGVIQIFTKRGALNSRPQVNAEASLGLIQTPYTGYDGILRQAYNGAVRGGSSDASYNVGASYSHTNAFVPDGEHSNYGVHGAVRYSHGIVGVDLSARYLLANTPSVFNPELSSAGLADFSQPNYQTYQYENQTVGVRFGLAPTPWWQHTLTVGIDRYSYDLGQTQRRLTTPADTLLTVSDASRTKTSIGYNTSAHGQLAAGVSGTLTVGFDHYRLPVASFFNSGLLTTTGTLQPAPGRTFSATRTITNNTGYFAQAQLGLRDALFLTGGLRAEQNSDFGDSLSTPLSPRVGLSYVQPVGAMTLKLRGSWGRAIRAPGPEFRNAAVSGTALRLASPALGPERQRGWDAGLDAVFASRGSLSVTYYDQTAENLINLVTLSAVPIVSQFQNVGRVGNSGIEVEGALALGPVELRAQYGYSRSRIEQLVPNYTGDLQIGDQVMGIPKHTAGASAGIRPFRATTISGGLTYVGSREQYDFMGFLRCLGQTGPCNNSDFALNRDYWLTYPAFTKIHVTITQQLAPMASGFISLDNLTNSSAPEITNANTVMGRITTIGLRLSR